MLILPVENKLNWKKPPVITLLLIAINCLVFFTYQAKDSKIYDEFTSRYEENELWTIERDLYIAHIRKAKPEQWSQTVIGTEFGENSLKVQLLHDLDFENLLHNRPDYQNTEWQTVRTGIEHQRNQLSYIQYGFNPAQPSLLDAFISMFLHGDFGHLLGNMIFLFLFGFSLESLLGYRLFLPVYLVTGIGSAGLYWLIRMGEHSFGVGASGAISGLMGAYLAAYGLRKISFFYWIGPYFNYLKAPALLIFPIWLGKEIIGQIFSNNNVNYWAHIGGLLSGVILVLALRYFKKQNSPNEQQIAPAIPEKTHLKRLDNLIEQMQTEKALTLCNRLLKSDPMSVELLTRQYQLSRHQPDIAFQKLVLKILQLPENPQENQLICQVTRDYCRLKKNQKLLTIQKVRLHWLKRLIKIDALPEAELLLKKLIFREDQTGEIKILATELAHKYKVKNPAKQMELLKLIDNWRSTEITTMNE